MSGRGEPIGRTEHARVVLVAVGLLVALIVAACGSPSAATSGGEGKDALAPVRSQIDGQDAAARTATLRRLARKEGTLALSTSLEDDVAATVAKAFERYAHVDVRLFRGSSEDVGSRTLEEQRAHRSATDVVEVSAVVLELLDQRGMLSGFRPAGSAKLAPGSVHPTWTATRTNRYVVAWNRDALGSRKPPRSWDDLTDPSWRGRIVMEVSDAEYAKTLTDSWMHDEGLSRAEADRRLDAIARNARFVDGHSLQTDLLARGEFDVAVGAYGYHVDHAAEKGSPLSRTPVIAPTVARPNGVGILRSAAHPAAAALFADWITGPGQKLLSAQGIEPADRRLSAAERSVPTAQVDLKGYLATQKEWDRRYERLIGLGGEGPSKPKG